MFTDKMIFKSILVLTKVCTFFLRKVLRTNATSLPGKIIFKLYPNFLSKLKDYHNKEIITVTGTNGKTTTAGLLSKVLQCSGNKVVHNEEGANMLTGIATSAANKLPLFGKSDYFVFESDEAYLSKLYNFIESNYLIVTNLFRDQLDRYGELATTAFKIKEAILKNSKLKLILNADDPMLNMLNLNKNIVWFGFDDIETVCYCEQSLSPADSINCQCGLEYKYTKHFYSHVGHYECKCGFKRPKPKYSAKAKIYKDFTEIKLNTNAETTFRVCLPNIYNAYNALAVITLAKEIGIDDNTIQSAFDTYKPMFGRAEKRTICGKKVFIQLIKNPTGATEVLRTISTYKDNSNLLIVINDNYADGRDVSWLWDTDFEILKTYPNKIFVSGIRALDMALRLKYAGVCTDRVIVEENMNKALNLALDSTDKDSQLLIMPTYTALLKLDKIR